MKKASLVFLFVATFLVALSFVAQPTSVVAAHSNDYDVVDVVPEYIDIVPHLGAVFRVHSEMRVYTGPQPFLISGIVYLRPGNTFREHL